MAPLRAPPSPGGRSTASTASSSSSDSGSGSGSDAPASRTRRGGGGRCGQSRGVRKPSGAPPRRLATRLVVRPLSDLDRAWLNRLKQLHIQGFFDPKPLLASKGPPRPARPPSPVLIQTTLLGATVAQGYEREDVQRLED